MDADYAPLHARYAGAAFTMPQELPNAPDLPSLMGGPCKRLAHAGSEAGQEGDPLRIKRIPADTSWAWLAFFCIVAGLVMTTKNIFTGASIKSQTFSNYHGLRCGVDSEVQHLPFLYFPIDPQSPKKFSLAGDRRICVARCPDAVDVAARAYVSIPESLMLQTKEKSAYVSVLHSIRSPLYASSGKSENICFPEHPTLQKEARRLLSDMSPQTMAASFIAGCRRALPLVIGTTLAGTLASYILFGVTLSLPGTIVAGLLLASLLLLITVSFQSLYVSVTLASPAADEDNITQGPRTMIFLGCSGLLMAVLLVTSVLSSFPALSSASSLTYAMTKSAHRFAGGSGLYPLMQLGMLAASLIGVMSIALIPERAEATASAITASLDPNGGLQQMPLTLTQSPAAWCSLKTAFLVFSTIWSLETVLTLTKFVATYTAQSRYITPAGQRAVSREPLHALITAFLYHLGSLLLFSGLRCLTRPVRVFTMLRSSTRYQALRDEPQPLDESTQQRINDHIHNAALSELVLNGGSLRRAVTMSAKRLKQTPFDALAASFGVISLITWTQGLFMGLLIYALAYQTLQSTSSVESSHMAAYPGLTATLLAIVGVYVTIVPWAALEASVDAILYASILEMEQKARESSMPIDPNMPGEMQNQYCACPPAFVEVINSVSRQAAERAE